MWVGGEGFWGGRLLAHLESFSNYTISQECRPAALVLLLLPDPGKQVPSSHFVYTVSVLFLACQEIHKQKYT